MDKTVLYLPDGEMYCSEECLLDAHPDALIAIDTRDVSMEEIRRNYHENLSTGRYWVTRCTRRTCERYR